MKRIVVCLLSAFLCLSSMPALCQQKELTLEDIYSHHTYDVKRPGPIKWLLDGSGYTVLEKNPVKGIDIIRYDPATGQRAVLIRADQIIPQGADSPLAIFDYSWSNDNSKLLIFTNTKKVWRYHTRGDYWVLNITSGKLLQLGKGLESATLMFAKFSPDGNSVAYVSKQNIYCENLQTDVINQLTHDGGGNIINGTFDWAYEEELDCRDGFRWSPDGSKIAYWQSNTKGVGTFYLIDNIDSIYSRPIPLPYPKVGTTNSAVKIGVISVRGGNTKWFAIPGDPRNHYLARMDFIPNSDEVMIQQLNRIQDSNRVWVGNTSTMELKNILTETDKAYLDLHDNIEWLDNNQAFTWTSERDGWTHLYKVSRDGGKTDLITNGDFDVVQICRIDPKGSFVYYIASPENYTQRYLYRSRLSGKTGPERLSPAGMPGQHAYEISPDARFAIHTYESSTTPPQISVTDLSSRSEIKMLENNAALKDRFDALGLRPKEFFKVDIGDVLLDAWMIKPKNFDPAKKYPLIFYVYGEPAGSTVQDKWTTGESLWHQYLAQQGYIIMSVDNRGTNVPRGRDFRKCIYRQIGLLAADDQAKAAKKILGMFSFIDSTRVGIWGWSGGGQMSLHCIFRHGDVYKTAIAVSFVSKQILYDNIYQERYMGLPWDNVEGYREGSPVTHAKNLHGNLMIIHGTADDNVHYQSFEVLVNELIKQNKLFSMMSYPMRTHSLRERENTSLHLRRTMENYWKKNLLPGPK